MVMASQGQMRMQRVQPVHFSFWTSTTTMAKGVEEGASSFTIQSGWGITDKQASHPEQRSGLMDAINFDFGFLAGIVGLMLSIKYNYNT